MAEVTVNGNADGSVDKSRRRLLIGTGVIGGVGVATAVVPFVMSFWPSARAKAAGAPIEVDISKIEPGQKIDVEWRGKVCWLVNRTKPMLAVGICTHLGCSPTFRPEVGPADLGPDWLGGFFCPCHQSKFDLAGRVFKGVPAPTNLVIPPHKYLSDTRIAIGVGEDGKEA